MILRAWLVSGLLLLAFLPIQDVAAVEPLSSKDLAEHCMHYAEVPDGEDAIFCVRYIQGFIDGAVATDERVMINVAAEYEKEETFSERAIRVRSPSRRLARYGPTAYAEFCVGEPITLKEVVEHVVDDLMNRKFLEETLLARDAVYVVLRRDYPCEAADVE